MLFTLIFGTILNSLKMISMLIIRIMFAKEKKLSISLVAALLLDLQRQQRQRQIS